MSSNPSKPTKRDSDRSMSRLEKQVRRLNPQILYTPRRKKSEDMLPNALTTTETASTSTSLPNSPTPDASNHTNANNNEKLSTPPSIMVENTPIEQQQTSEPSILIESPTPPLSTPVASSSFENDKNILNISPTTTTEPDKMKIKPILPAKPNIGENQKQQKPPPPLASINSVQSTQRHQQQSHHPNYTSANTEMGKSVIVNLSLTGSISEDKRRLSKLLREVNEMREIRDRSDSIGSHEEFEEKTRKKEKAELQKARIQRSKHLLFKYRVYDFLKRPASFAATVYHVFAFLLVAACLIVSVYPAIQHEIGRMELLDALEKIVLFWFTAEFILRLWSSDCRPQYQGMKGKIAFFKSPAHLIDLVVIILSAALPSISSHDGHEVFAFRAFRGVHRFFQVLQVIAIKRQLRPWRVFWSVLYDQREQLLIIFYLEIMLLCGLSYLGFLVEHEANQDLSNIADAIWWSVVTLTTVGYGDKTPITWVGKAISGTFILFGVAVFALPAGIIGAGLALKLEEVERSRQRRRKKTAAATLIQRAWKCYHANHSYYELSVFFRHQPGDLFKVRVYDHIMKAFIATVNFHVAKNSFKELTRPVDLRNVIESYKYGQMDIFSRLKQLNSALDMIISRMAMAEHERILALNQLARQLGQLERIDESLCDTEHNKIDDAKGLQSPNNAGTKVLHTKAGTFLTTTTATTSTPTKKDPNNTGDSGVISGSHYFDIIHVPTSRSSDETE